MLILTDMYGGTPSNVAMTFLQPGKVEVLTGVNLPMVLRLACQQTEERDQSGGHGPLAPGQGAAEPLPGERDAARRSVVRR